MSTKVIRGRGWWPFISSWMDAQTPAWSVTKFCDETGVGQSLVSNWKNKGFQPAIESLRRIAAGTGIPMLTLLVESGHIDADEAEGKAPPLPELPDLDVVAAVEADPDLLPEAKEHLVNQYALLLRVAASEKGVSRGKNDGPGLRAVARRRGDRNSDGTT